MLRKYVLLSAFLVLSFLSCHTMAAVVGYTFTGSVNEVGQPVFGISPAIGSAVTGRFTFDTTLAPTNVTSFSAHYQIYVPYELEAFIDGKRIQSDGFFGVDVQNDFGGNVEDTLFVGSQPAIVDGIQTLDGVFSLSFASTNPNTFADTGLPAYLNLSDFDAWHYGTFTRAGNNFEIIQFSIDSITAVPVPASWIMLLSGLGIFVTAARRKLRV